jgi:hypothetical protein
MKDFQNLYISVDSGLMEELGVQCMSSLLDYYWNQLGNRVGRGGSANPPKAHKRTHTHRNTLALLRRWFL